jgi:hypothetical protein
VPCSVQCAFCRHHLAAIPDTHRSNLVRTLPSRVATAGYGVVLSIILGRRDIDEHTRQAAGVHLKRYCARHWPADAEEDEEFVAPTASEADRAQIRHLLPQILVDPSSKLRTAAVRVGSLLHACSHTCFDCSRFSRVPHSRYQSIGRP